MADTYNGACKKCEAETDLINGICEECMHKQKEIVGYSVAFMVVDHGDNDKIHWFAGTKKFKRFGDVKNYVLRTFVGESSKHHLIWCAVWRKDGSWEAKPYLGMGN